MCFPSAARYDDLDSLLDADLGDVLWMCDEVYMVEEQRLRLLRAREATIARLASASHAPAQRGVAGPEHKAAGHEHRCEGEGEGESQGDGQDERQVREKGADSEPRPVPAPPVAHQRGGDAHSASTESEEAPGALPEAFSL